MKTQMTFRKAERKKAKLRLALCGVSGSGKTYSAIKIGKGLGGKIAMIDTENGSGELYAHLADYDVLTVTAPYSVEKYIEAIHAAEKAGYSTIIIDSLSHAWAGAGGILEVLDNVTKASKSKNSYHAWRDVTPQHNALVDAMLASPLHIIATMRSKTAYESQKNEHGKVTPVKVGLAPVQRDGMEYEFTVVLDLSVENNIATASKDRTGIFTGKYIKLSEETGEQLLEWLNTGADAVPEKTQEPAVVAEQSLLPQDNKYSRQEWIDEVNLTMSANECKKIFANGWMYLKKHDPDGQRALKVAYDKKMSSFEIKAPPLYDKKGNAIIDDEELGYNAGGNRLNPNQEINDMQGA